MKPNYQNTINLVYRLIEGTPTKNMSSVDIEDIADSLREFKRLDPAAQTEVLQGVVARLNNCGTICHLTDEAVVFIKPGATEDPEETLSPLFDALPYEVSKPKVNPSRLVEVPITDEDIIPDF